MTELEEIIYEAATKFKVGLYERCAEAQTEARFLKIPFFCNGAYDKLVFDRDLNRFTHIEYLYQVSKYIREQRTIPIAEDDINFNIQSN